jgi:hypothetical protein
MKKHYIQIAILSSVFGFSVNAMAQTNEIYRYKDKDGNLVYTDKLPRGKPSEIGVLSKKTGVLKNYSELEAAKVAQEMTEEEKLKLEETKLKETEQFKKDQHLLNTYSNVQEINQIKQYELDQIDKAMQNDKNSLENIKNRKNQIQKEMKNSAKATSKISFEEEIARLDDMQAKITTSLERSQKMYSDREQKYNNERERFTAVIKMINKEKEEKAAKTVSKE